MKNITKEAHLEEKLKELESHYLTYRKLIDNGLVIATTSFISYLDAVGFDSDNRVKWNIYISSKTKDWGEEL